jgi:hypothetical protein
MSGLGGNLNYKDRPLLLNTLTVKDFGTYKETDPDSGAVREHLVIKPIALDMVYDASVKVQVSKTQEGALKSVLLSLDAPAPCQDCHYDYGISIIKKVRQPGVLNDDITVRERSYGGILETVQPSLGGYMADSDKVVMEDAIIKGILLDRDLGTREEAVVDARRLYIVTVTAVDTQTLDITDDSGTETILLNGGTTVQKMVHDINTDSTKGILAFGLSDTRIAVTSAAVGKSFTLADGGGAGLGTIDRFIWVTSRTVDSQFEVRFDPGFLTLARFNVVRLSNQYTAAGSGNVFAIGGKSTASATGSATSQTYAAAITTAFTNASLTGYATAVKEGSKTDVWLYTANYELKVKALSTGVSVAVQYSGSGRYANLTWEDVFREFTNRLHLNGLSHLVPLGQPEPGSKWNKVVISRMNTIASQHGANHGNDYLQVQTFYLRQGYGATALWHDPDESNQPTAGMWEGVADNANFSATKNLNEIIVAWGSAGSLASPGII